MPFVAFGAVGSMFNYHSKTKREGKPSHFVLVRVAGLDSRRDAAKPSFDFGFATLLGQSRL